VSTREALGGGGGGGGEGWVGGGGGGGGRVIPEAALGEGRLRCRSTHSKEIYGA